MTSPLIRNMLISAAVHVFLVATIIFFSFRSCRANRPRREITTFIDLRVMSADEETTPVPGPQDIPEPVPEPTRQESTEPPRKKTIDVSKRRVKREVSPAKNPLAEKDIREMLRATEPFDRQDAIRDEFARYLVSVRAVMYKAWQQPGALSGASGLETRVLIRVQRDGRIIHREIILPAGNELMDASVRSALESVQRLPELPRACGDYEDITIDFELAEAGP